jgi:Gas vesicle protein
MSLSEYRTQMPATSGGSGNLADILERVLDKGVVIAGDISINLLDIELLTIKLRLLIASADTAQKMGIDWWKNDPFLTGEKQVGLGNGKEQASLSEGESKIEERLERIEKAIASLAPEAG